MKSATVAKKPFLAHKIVSASIFLKSAPLVTLEKKPSIFHSLFFHLAILLLLSQQETVTPSNLLVSF